MKSAGWDVPSPPDPPSLPKGEALMAASHK